MVWSAVSRYSHAPATSGGATAGADRTICERPLAGCLVHGEDSAAARCPLPAARCGCAGERLGLGTQNAPATRTGGAANRSKLPGSAQAPDRLTGRRVDRSQERLIRVAVLHPEVAQLVALQHAGAPAGHERAQRQDEPAATALDDLLVLVLPHDRPVRRCDRNTG